jgi:hypothetical protein
LTICHGQGSFQVGDLLLQRLNEIGEAMLMLMMLHGMFVWMLD